MNWLKLLPVASLLLTACATFQPQGPSPTLQSPQWTLHQKSIAAISAYQTRGSFAYISGVKKVYAKFFWQQFDANRYHLVLMNPLGGTELDIMVTSALTTVTTKEGEKYTGRNAETMINQMTGMALPLDQLHSWLIGLPGVKTEVKINRDFTLKSVDYTHKGANWHVDYQAYNSQQPRLPKRLELTQGEALKIKLKLDKWTLE